MTVSLGNVWIIFSSIILVTAPLLGTLTGFLIVRLFVTQLAGFFSKVRDAALKFFKKGEE